MLVIIYGGIVNIIKNYKLLFLCIALIGCGAQSDYGDAEYNIDYTSKKQPTIVNGTVGRHLSFPVTVGLIREDGSLFCTGTLIKPQLVLTAAHCIVSKFGDTIYAIYGCDDANHCPKKHRVNVAAISIFPFYDKALVPWNDIGLVLLAQPIKQSSDIQLLHPSLYDIVLKINKKTTLVGYGRTSDVGSSGKLYYGSAPIITKNSYEIQIGKDDNTTSNVCYGDSGSSFYIEHNNNLYVTGIASRLIKKNPDTGEWCGGGSVYALPGEYNDWIENEYNDMLDVFNKSNHMILRPSRCSIGYARTYDFHITLFILLVFYVRKRKII